MPQLGSPVQADPLLNVVAVKKLVKKQGSLHNVTNDSSHNYPSYKNSIEPEELLMKNLGQSFGRKNEAKYLQMFQRDRRDTQDRKNPQFYPKAHEYDRVAMQNMSVTPQRHRPAAGAGFLANTGMNIMSPINQAAAASPMQNN